MPVGVLATRGCVEIEDGVDAVLSTDVNDAVQVFEPGLLEDARVHVI